MRVPLSWLREFVALDLSVEEIVATLDDLGLAVESVTTVGAGLEGVVVARVLDIAAIEGADRIRAVTVDAGGPEPVPVVCGAWNFAVGDLVPLATVGTVLPGGMEITARRMRGARSEGMLCAPDELELPGGHDGILVLDGDHLPGSAVSQALGRSSDTVLELEVNANRPDAMSVAGVARDLAARLRLPFALPEPKVPEGPAGGSAQVVIDDPGVCGRFVAQVVTGVAVGPSPGWLAERLVRAGMRPINNVVDISNYVMLELGQPTHPYSLARLPGRGLRVRRARAGETLVTLDGAERQLGPEDPLICATDDRPLGIAGIMGGASSEIDATTTEVLVEAAWFDPLSIARSSRRLKLRSEASARFEKGCDWQAIDRALGRICELLHQCAGGAVPAGAPFEAVGRLPERPPVRLRTERVNQLLGTDLSADHIAGYLAGLGFVPSVAGEGVLAVSLPSWRLDSATEIDLVEEVARLHGYRSIPSTLPRSPLTGGLSPYQHDRRRARQILAGAGADEVWTSTFVSPAEMARCGLDPAEAVVVANPLVVEQSRLRTSLLPGLVEAVAANARRRQPGVQLFEIGACFARPPTGQSLPTETERVGAAAAGRDATEAVSLWRLLAESFGFETWQLEPTDRPGLHPTRAALVMVGEHTVGALGEIDPAVTAAAEIAERVAWLELDLGLLLAQPHGAASYRPVSRFPSSDIDLAFEIDESTPAAAVEATLRRAGGELVRDLELFDVYRGDRVAPHRRSLAWRVRFQAPDRTLTDDDVAEARDRLVRAVEAAHPASLRG
ncbi:MAG TPA: phenylalanine--tRNA ligase subunit beta [Acidimicrobiales bacterium]|nr:phenylalanine--tRNA ligase subunit beta [Acidimicrobiales bacterium]